MTVQEAFKKLTFQLYSIYDDREAENIAQIVTEDITGFGKMDRILNKSQALNPQQEALFEDYAEQLIQLKPVQYVISKCWFAGMELYVNEKVLIPRPETEELTDWITNDFKTTQQADVMDIGTGSGCIALAIKKKFPGFKIVAADNSKDALSVAEKNAVDQHADIVFKELDILKINEWSSLSSFNIIVSNPPYVLRSEAAQMADVVLNYEPHPALFVPDINPMLFYTCISDFASTHLYPDGVLYFEINESLADEVVDVLQKNSFKNIEVRKDMQGKKRMIKATGQ